MKEYVIRVDDDGVRSKHDDLVRLAERCRRASRLDRDDIEVEGPDDDVADYLAYLIHDESGSKKSR
jgi:hypothetical protein